MVMDKETILKELAELREVDKEIDKMVEERLMKPLRKINDFVFENIKDPEVVEEIIRAMPGEMSPFHRYELRAHLQELRRVK